MSEVDRSTKSLLKHFQLIPAVDMMQVLQFVTDTEWMCATTTVFNILTKLYGWKGVLW